MEATNTRGYLFQTTLNYIRNGLHPERREQALAKVTPEMIRFIEAAKATEWYPIARYNELLDIIAYSGDGSDGVAKDDLIGCGSFAANEATNTFLKLLMKVLTPTLFAKKLPSLFERDFTRGKVRVTVSDDRLVCHLSDVKEFKHIAPSSAGWATFTLQTMGKSLLERNVKGWSLTNTQPDECEFELIWRT